MVHDADTARERHGFFLIVSDHHEGDAELVLQADEFELRVFAQLLVERAQRFIEQQQFRALHQRSRQSDSLLLAARQLVRLALGEIAELDQVQHGRDALGDLCLRHAILLQAEGHVLFHRHVRKQRIRLKHHVHRALIGRTPAMSSPSM